MFCTKSTLRERLWIEQQAWKTVLISEIEREADLPSNHYTSGGIRLLRQRHRYRHCVGWAGLDPRSETELKIYARLELLLARKEWITGPASLETICDHEDYRLACPSSWDNDSHMDRWARIE